MINGVVPVNGEHRRCSVLVVEDNPTMRLLLKHVLKTEYEVEKPFSMFRKERNEIGLINAVSTY